jgi:ferric-dicitrate binding protein FerR (iron transport regulator)
MSRDEEIGELLKLSGRRRMPDAAQMARARAAARAEWKQVLGHRRWRLSLWGFASAALVAAALLAVAWFRADGVRMPAVPPDEIARVQTVRGTVSIAREGVRQTSVYRGTPVRAGDRLDTSAGSRATLGLAGGISVAFDQDSSALLEAAGGIALDRGALFVDAGPDAHDRTLHVTTAFGVVRHVGTQFEMRLQEGGLRVRVREGSISIENGYGRWVSHEAEALVLTRGAPPQRQAIPTSGAEWSWVDELAPPFTLEGSTLGALLQWVSRYHGLRWRYAEPELGARVESIVLHGSIDGLTAQEALEAVLPACGLTFRRNGDRFIIARQ